MRQEQRNHFEEEDRLKEVALYRDFVRPAIAGRDTLLDLGTGAGYGVLAVADGVKKVIATDAEAEMVEAARQTCSAAGVSNVDFRQMRAEEIDFPDSSLDGVQIRFSLHHFDSATRALSEAARVLKPGGILLLADAFLPEAIAQVWTITSLLRHGKWTPYFTYRQHMDMLREAGLQVQTMRPSLLVQSFDEFYRSAPEVQREPLRAIVEHLRDKQRQLLHFQVEDGVIVRYAYEGFELIARKP